MYKSLAFVILTICSQAHAGLIDNTTYFTDTTSGIDWLKLDQTVNYSYDDIVHNQLDTGDFSGWSIATIGLVRNLFDNAGGDGMYHTQSNTTSTTPMVNTLAGLFTLTNNDSTQAWFHIQDTTPGPYSSGVILDTNGEFGSIYQYNGRNFSDRDEAYSHIGTALVRRTRDTISNDIPEPSTLAIFALGLMGLASRRFNKQY